MKVTYNEIGVLPEIIRSKIKLMELSDTGGSTATPTMNEEEKIIVESLLTEGNKYSIDKASISAETNLSPNNV